LLGPWPLPKCDGRHTCVAAVPLQSRSLWIKRRGSPMNYLFSIFIIALLASQAMIWHSLVGIREAIVQGNAMIVAACGSDERPCQVAAHRGQLELGEVMVRTPSTPQFPCTHTPSRPCSLKTTA